MTRIITITGGMAQVGKTHLAVNLALELVRRGRFAGVLQEAAPGAGALLELQALPESQEDHDETRGIRRQGYQGIDVLDCETPLRCWLSHGGEQRLACLGAIDGLDGYDDLLIDTSAMDRRSQLACCQVADMVVLVVTPTAVSQAEAFALLRVLSLNGFAQPVYLLVNRSLYPVDSKDVYDGFLRLVKRHLGLEPGYLGAVAEDRRVSLAGQNRQAFSSLFPDSGATAGIVAAVDILEDATIRRPGGQTLSSFSGKLLAVLQRPVCLPGGGQLEDMVTAAESPETLAGTVAGRERSGSLGLLQYAGDVAGLWRFLELLPPALQSLGSGLGELIAHEGERDVTTGKQPSVLVLLAQLLSLLGEEGADSVDLDVSDTFVTGQQPCWLPGGRYLKYVLQLPPGPLPDSVTALLAQLPDLVNSHTADGETIHELLDPLHNHCLDVVCSKRTGARIQVWLPVDGGVAAGGMQDERVVEKTGKDLH